MPSIIKAKFVIALPNSNAQIPIDVTLWKEKEEDGERGRRLERYGKKERESNFDERNGDCVVMMMNFWRS